MLNIIKQSFTVCIYADSKDEIKNKFEEFDIWVRSEKPYVPPICEGKILRIYFECSAYEENFNKLVRYLKDDFKGRATLTY